MTAGRESQSMWKEAIQLMWPIVKVAAEEKRENPQDMRFQTGFDLELQK